MTANDKAFPKALFDINFKLDCRKFSNRETDISWLILIYLKYFVEFANKYAKTSKKILPHRFVMTAND